MSDTNVVATKRPGGRQRLLDAASELFAFGGFEGVSVSQILDLSALKAPSLYHHFGDKEGLYVAWASAALDQLRVKILEVEQKGGTLHAKLERVVDVIMDGHTIDLLQLQRDIRLLKGVTNPKRLNLILQDALYMPLKLMFAEAMANGEIKSGDAERLAHLFVHSTMSLHPTYAIRGSASETDPTWLVQLLVGTANARGEEPTPA